MYATLTCLLVAPTSALRQSLQDALERTDDISLVGATDDEAMMLRLSQQLRPDVILVSWSHFLPESLTILKELHALFPHSKTLVLGNDFGKPQVLTALKVGAWGYLNQSTTSIPAMLDAIRTVGHGGAVLSSEAAGWVLDALY